MTLIFCMPPPPEHFGTWKHVSYDTGLPEKGRLPITHRFFESPVGRSAYVGFFPDRIEDANRLFWGLEDDILTVLPTVKALRQKMHEREIPLNGALLADIDVHEQQPLPAENLLRNFHWLYPGRLGGLAAPEAETFEDWATFYANLAWVGCDRLVSLRSFPPNPELAEPHHLKAYHFPIADMNVPESIADTFDVCQQILKWFSNGEQILVHCEEGNGRTGLLLACVLVCQGKTAERAIAEIRSVNADAIEGIKQEVFISQFAEFVVTRLKEMSGK